MISFEECSTSCASPTRDASSHNVDARHRAKHGFALVVALSLMSFVMLLLLSLTSLVRVSSEASVRQIDVIHARQNALLSMQVALGKLQQYTGPDQRVTALSGSQGGSTRDGSSILPGSKYWVGVWDSDEESGTYEQQLGPASGPNAGQPEWLISGGDELDPTSDNPVAASGVNSSGVIPDALAGDYALLLGPKDLSTTGSSNPEDFVVAPVESVGPAGGIAWWVSDEGVKAKITGDRHEENQDLTSEQADILKILAPQRTGLDAIAGLGAFERDSGIGWKEISKLNTLNDTALLGGGDNALLNAVKNNYHGLSLYSQGVLADVRNGGLKKDLTHGFHPISGNRLKIYAKSEQVFEDIAYQEGNRRAQIRKEDDPGGPFWDQLASYANTKPVGGVIKFQPHSDTQYGVMPIVTQVKVYYHALWVEYPGSQIGIRFVILPQFVMNNPYPYTLSMEDTYFQILHGPTGKPNNIYELDERDPGFSVRASGAGSFSQAPYSSPYAENTIEYLKSFNPIPVVTRQAGPTGHQPSLITYRIKGYDFPPGATRTFSPLVEGYEEQGYGLQKLVYDYSGNSGALINTLAEGDRPGGGFFIDVLPDLSGLLGPNSLGRIALSDITGSNLANLPMIQMTGYHSNDIHIVFGRGNKAKSISNVSGTVVTDPFKIIYRLGAWGLASYYAPDIPNTDTNRRNSTNLRPLAISSNDNSPSFGFDHSLRLSENYMDNFASPDIGFRHKLPWLAHYNPAANFSMRSPYDWPTDFVGGFINNPSYIGATVVTTDDYGINGADSPYFGVADNYGGNETILFDLPTEDSPLTSIGQLMHANPSRNFDFDFNEDGDFLDDMLDNYEYDERYFAGNYHPTYAIGNSLLNGKIPERDSNRDGKNDTYLSWKQQFRRSDQNGLSRRGVHYDYSYLLNDALWDNYFFSAIDFDGGDVTGNFPHANSRLLLHGDPDNSDFTGRGFDKSAAHLVLDGAFNVNSNSVQAWKALLASFMNTGKDPVSNESSLQRMVEPTGFAFGGGDDDTSPNSYIGFRRLNETELETLAEEIVDEIERRMDAQERPFLSLSEFINRSLDSSYRSADLKEFRKMGALQAAIDRSELNENMEYEVDSPRRRQRPRDEDHAEDYLSRNITTYLSQADLLARLGSVLTARSDTFVIRSYGDVRDPISGEVNSRAWCEAVVQRKPEYVSSNDSSEVAPDNLSDPDNRQWGRRYEVVSMRWLTADDIIN